MIRNDQTDRPALTSAMIEAGEKVFLNWIEQPDHMEGLIELPSMQSIHALLAAIFASMAAAKPDSCIN